MIDLEQNNHDNALSFPFQFSRINVNSTWSARIFECGENNEKVSGKKQTRHILCPFKILVHLAEQNQFNSQIFVLYNIHMIIFE